MRNYFTKKMQGLRRSFQDNFNSKKQEKAEELVIEQIIEEPEIVEEAVVEETVVEEAVVEEFTAETEEVQEEPIIEEEVKNEIITVRNNEIKYETIDGSEIEVTGLNVIAHINNTFIFENDIEHLPAFAFGDQFKLKSITLPRSLKSMDRAVFYRDGNLDTFIFTGTQEEWDAIDKHERWRRGTPEIINLQCLG